MKLIQALELATQRHRPLRNKRLMVCMGAHGKRTTAARIRREIETDYLNNIWKGIIK